MFKKATWRQRCLPDFLIVGCQKGGTSSLHSYLTQHERLLPADIKEVHYFDGGLDAGWDKFADGEPLYRSYFPLRQDVARASALTFEASPCYMFNPLAPGRMAELVPDAKLIVLLRDPVERAISHYFHEVRRGREDLPIMDALHAEQERLTAAIATNNYKDLRWINQSYVKRGRYAEQLQCLFASFDRSRVLVIDSADFFSDPGRVLSQVLDFVGVDAAGFKADLKPVGVASNKKAAPDEVYAFLTEAFEEPNQELADLLQRDFSWLRQ